MERNTKQQQLIFDKGITNVPSDILCSDNTLEESIGMVYDDGEHRVIQRPKLIMTGAPAILYVHKYNDGERFITQDGNDIKWGTNEDGVYTPAQSGSPIADVILLTASGKVQVTSIGKTLIISDDNGLHYAIWKNDGYKVYDKIPSPAVSVRLTGGAWCTSSKEENVSSVISILPDHGIVQDKQDEYNNLIVGLYSKNKREAGRMGRFVNPFMLRYALKMIDGNYTFVGNPIMLIPSMRHNSEALLENYDSPDIKLRFTLSTFGSFLEYKQLTDYSDFSDIVKGVTLFVSRQVDTIDTQADQPAPDNTSQNRKVIGIYQSGIVDASLWHSVDFDTDYYAVMKTRREEDVERELSEGSVFYKLCDIEDRATGWSRADFLFDEHTLENITTQDQLTEDDYYSRSDLVAGVLYAYNSRLNIADVKRSFFEGFANFLPYDNSNLSSYHFYVRIKTDNGDIVVHRDNMSAEKQGLYFYYPDSRAKHVWIYKDGGVGVGDCILDVDLTEHPGLNGAYYFRGLPITDYQETPITPEELPVVTTPLLPEPLPNYIITSEVNNPFVFKAEGYNKVGNGKIRALSTVTMALSEDQFGRTDMLVFTDDGVWGMTVDSTGLFSSAHPMSRDVVSEPVTLVQVDKAVFFSSEKGMMVVSDGGVRCVSEQMNGKVGRFNISRVPFQEYLTGGFVAYDYRDSLLWIFNTNSGFSQYNYVYNIKNGTFAKVFLGSAIVRVVNNYPDYLLQDYDGAVYSLLNRPNINSDDDDDRYEATMVTRPMKLENGLALKSIMQMKHIMMLDNDAQLTVSIEASNNLTGWVPISSLKGLPWKYYRMTLSFENLLATDRYAGCIIMTQERRTNKLR